MKKILSIFILILLYCNISMADERVFGGKSVDLIYSCYSKDLKQKDIILGFNHIIDFNSRLVTHHYDHQNKKFGPAINHVMVANLDVTQPLWLLSWNDLKENGFHTYLLKFHFPSVDCNGSSICSGNELKDLKSNINKDVEIESYFISNKEDDEDEKKLKSEIFNLRKKLFNEKNFDKFKETYYLHDDKMRILHDKLMSDEFVAIFYKCKRLNKL